MRIFLVGMMGSGKSTLGRQLAESLQYAFVDLDAFIEQRAQKSIAALFEMHGADTFRLIERQALEAVVSEHTDAVIATGGGTPCFFDNMSYINQHGKSIFIEVPAEEIFKRLSTTNLSERPLLAGKSDAELKEFIATTLQQRIHFYEQATYTLHTQGAVTKDIQTLLNIK